jgi:hypothetical protein
MTKQQQKQQPSLNIPLMGDEQCYDEQLSDMKAAQESSAPRREEAVVVEKRVETMDKQEDQNQGYSSFFSFVMPLFLFIQFAFAFSYQHDNETAMTTTSVPWSTVNLNIVMFAVTIWLYRWSCMDSHITNSLLLLLPEIITNIVLVILLFHKIATALVALLVGMQLMSVLALANTIHFLYSKSRSKNNAEQQQQQEEEEEEEEEEETDDIYQANQVDLLIF